MYKYIHKGKMKIEVHEEAVRLQEFALLCNTYSGGSAGIT